MLADLPIILVPWTSRSTEIWEEMTVYPHFICPSVSLIHALCYFNMGKIIMLRFFDNCSFALLMCTKYILSPVLVTESTFPFLPLNMCCDLFY